MYCNDLKPLESLLLSDSNVGLLQRNWTKAVVKVKETSGWVHTQEGSHILGRGGGQSRLGSGRRGGGEEESELWKREGGGKRRGGVGGRWKGGRVRRVNEGKKERAT